MDIYEELGLTKLINCAGTYTVVGGSRMSDETLKAMEEAAHSHVEIRKMQEAVHREVAKMTKNEAAVITAGAIVGVYLTIAGCISMKHGKAMKYLDKNTIAETEIIMFRSHRNPYDRGLELSGAKVVELGYPNNIDIVTEELFENTITDKTAGVLYLPSTNGGWVPPGALEIDKTIAICRKHNIPVVVDAAAQLPPKSNLWHFTKNIGASAVIFSGGKNLKGPQTTGLVLGKKDLLYWVNENNFPTYGIGRMHKVGREELAGIYMAVKQYLNHNEEEENVKAEQIVKMFADAFNLCDGFHFERSYPNEAGQPIARAKLIITKKDLSPEKVRDYLLNQEQAVFSMIENGCLYVNPMTITMEEAKYILEVYRELNDKEKEI